MAEAPGIPEDAGEWLVGWPCSELNFSNSVLLSVVILVDYQGRLEQNREVFLFNLGQSLKGKDIAGNEAKVFGLFAAVKWDKRWAKKAPGKLFYSCQVASKRVLHIWIPAYDYALLYGSKAFLMTPEPACAAGI
jgi:hypothetical protein